MTTATKAATLVFPGLLCALAAACSKSMQADPTPDIALSTSDEGIAPGPRMTPRTTGDTLVCETPRRYRTAEGDRWLWVRIIVERKPGEATERAFAETVVSSDAEGMQTEKKVALAGVRLDGEREYTLRNSNGVRTRDPKEGARRTHSARGYTRGPDLGPVEAICPER